MSTGSTFGAVLRQGYILCMDIVGSTTFPPEMRVQLAERLEQLVRRTTDFRRITQSAPLIPLDLGDGFALVFFDDPQTPVRCGVELNQSCRPEPELKVRIGIHAGPVLERIDIAGKPNVRGDGMDMAARTTDCGDAGHILVSKAVVDALPEGSVWKSCLHDLGLAKIKHDRIRLFNLCGSDFGNNELPHKLRTIFDVPIAEGPLRVFFTGREEVLKKLQAALGTHRRAALTGLGGVGKSHTAAHYAYLHRDEYKAVLWSGADSEKTLVSSFAALAKLLDLPQKDAQDQNLAVAAVRQWLKDNGDWLLILDNVEDLKVAADFIPPQAKGHVIFTTQAQSAGAVAQPIEIGQMESSEAALLILRRTRRIDKATLQERSKAEEIASALDNLPLALDQAGAYVEESGCSLTDYLTFYRKQPLELLKARGWTAQDHRDPVALTVALSFDKVERADPAAAELLCLCAFLHPDAIPEDIFAKGASELGPVFQPVAADPFRLNEAIRQILRYSLLRRDSDHKTVSIHRLVQTVLSKGMPKDNQRVWAERAVRAVNLAFPAVAFENWAQCEQLLPHALACARLIVQENFSFLQAAHLLTKAGAYLHQRTNYQEAEPLLLRSLAIREMELGPEHLDVAASLNGLVLLYNEQGRYGEAEPLCVRALAIREKSLGPEHPDVAQSLQNLASLHNWQGRYSEAEPLHQRSLAIREKTLGMEHLDVAGGLTELALLYYWQGRYNEAEQINRRALAIREKALGPEHPDVAGSVQNLALMYDLQGRYAEAEPLYRRSLATWEKAFGFDHPETATALNNLAMFCDQQGKYGEAEPLFLRALAMYESVLGPDHPHVARCLNNVGGFYKSQRRYEEAQPLMLRSVASRQKALGPDHPDVAQSLNNLGDLYRLQSRYQEAEPLLLRSLVIRENALGVEHPYVARTLQFLALLYNSQERYAEADRLFVRALAIREKALGLEHLDVAATLHHLALLRNSQSRYGEAEPLFLRALAIREKALGPEHSDVVATLESYATLMRAMGRGAEAEPLEVRVRAFEHQRGVGYHPHH